MGADRGEGGLILPGDMEMGQCGECQNLAPLVQVCDDRGRIEGLMGVVPMLVRGLCPVANIRGPGGEVLLGRPGLLPAQLANTMFRWTEVLLPHEVLCPSWWLRNPAGPPILAARWMEAGIVEAIRRQVGRGHEPS